MVNALFRVVAASSALFLALAVWAGCAAYRVAPPRVGLAEAPAEAHAQAVAALQAEGYTPAGPLAWSGVRPEWQAPGDYRVFFAAAPLESGMDIFTTDLHVNTDGTVAGGAPIRRVTDTPGGDEQAPVVGGGWLAYATRVGDRYQSVTGVPLADLDRRLVFVFEQPPEQVVLGWRSVSASPLLVVAARGPVDPAESVVDLATGAVEPPGGGLTYISAVRGEQAWLPNLVSRVRELPFIGPEKIAFLENVFFTLVDKVEQAAYRVTGSAPAEPAHSVSANNGEGSSDVGPESAPAETPAPTSTSVVAPTAIEPAASTPADVATPPMTAIATTSPTARPEPSPTATSAAAPSPTPAGVRLAEGIRHLGKLRPDPQRPYADAEVIELDPSLLQIKMIPGTIEPQPTTGLIGTGVIPREDWGSLVAGFNGGFAAMHGKFGMMVDRKVYLPARDGIATLAVYEDGSLRMGTWGADLKQTPDMVSYRQNCPPLIENGTITAETGKLTLWGLSIANEVYLYRSGLGIRADGRLIYVAGKPLSAYTLARALQEAGAVYAMQLDVDEYHVAFITYDVKPGKAGGPPEVEGKKLRADMRGFDGLFLRPFQLDFFYLVRRPQPLARPVRIVETTSATTTPPTGASETQAIPNLPGHLAFTSNRDGNWEIYAMPAGQPAAARRLTNHSSDDLYPAWSPDGTQIAFTSRRDGNADIYIVRLTDGALRRVTRQPSEEWAPAWSPDGTRLAYQSDRNAQSDIYVSTLVPDATGVIGSQETRLTPWQGNHESPHWSPDGRLIVFDSDLDVSEAVHASINMYLMNANGTEPRRIFSHAESPAWSPDGKTIAFNGLRGGRWQIMLLNADSSGYRQLATGAYDARYPAWSPDGRWLAFAGNEVGHWEIYVLPAAGGQPIRLTRGATDNTHPAWGP